MIQEIFIGASEADICSNKHDADARKKQVQNKAAAKQKQDSSRKQVYYKETTKQKAKQVSSVKQVYREDARKPKIKWPNANSKECPKIDEDLKA